MFELEFVYANGTAERAAMQVTEEEKGKTVVSFPKERIPEGVEQINVIPEFLSAKADEDGYYIIPELWIGNMLCRIREREDDEYVCHAAYIMPIMGAKRGETAHLLVLTGMTYDYDMVTGVKNGVYYSYPRLLPQLRPIYENIEITIYELTGNDANYSGMARKYREHQLKYAGIRPLSARARERDTLKYALDAVEIRIRHAWKPAPPEILHQTIENEPPMHVAMDFKRVEDLIAEMKRQGVEKAELCLVGWNRKGHDGRWPQIFPVEPDLGGEEGLKHLIQTAQEAGYQIVCHTNSSDAYTVAECWDEDYIIKNRDGSLKEHGENWSGGKMYQVCAKASWEKFAQSDLPKVAALGFRGIHYIDVISVVPPRTCWDPKHPTTTRECVEYWNKILHFAGEQFGGIASEGAYDFAVPELDFSLYVNFNLMGDHPAICDEVIPLWQIVYHGIVSSNPSAETVNMPIKGEKARLKFYEFGGRPALYYYSKFVDHREGRSNWMGETDFLCDTDEQLQTSVTRMKKMMDEYKPLADLQYCYIYSHDKLAEGIYRTVYENGVQMVFNYTDAPFAYENKTVAPMDFCVYR